MCRLCVCVCGCVCVYLESAYEAGQRDNIGRNSAGDEVGCILPHRTEHTQETSVVIKETQFRGKRDLSSRVVMVLRRRLPQRYCAMFALSVALRNHSYSMMIPPVKQNPYFTSAWVRVHVCAENERARRQAEGLADSLPRQRDRQQEKRATQRTHTHSGLWSCLRATCLRARCR
jgi:hypothetical protein